MSDDPRRLTTEEERERVRAARRRGSLCARCGKMLAADEPVYVERVAVILKPFTAASTRSSQRTVHWDMPVGVECAAPEFVRRTEGRAPERCAGCGRPVYYTVQRAGRRRAVCSQVCRSRADNARRAAKPRGG
jgi:hypothetical protein